MVPSTPFGSSPFKSSTEVYEWLSRFANFERGQGKDLCLDRINTLAEMAGRPEKYAPSVHVAGSKGKGSVTGMIAAILETSGIKTARYASPHVCDFRERILLGTNFFDEDIYIRAGMELRELVEKLPGSGEDSTFFELMTLWFFLCGRLALCGALAVETGMGGRLDATNILIPLVSVITLIELEHTEYLGGTIAAIAAEKAGIIKPGKPLVLAEQCDEALEVFREYAVRNKSPLLYFPDCAELHNIRIDRHGTHFTLILKKDGLLDAGISAAKTHTIPDLFVPIPGEVQARNAGLAVLAAGTAFPGIREECIREGLAGFTLPARFERISDTPPFIIDGAHTPGSVELCVKTFTSLYGDGGVLIFGCAAGKDILSMAKLCVPFFSRIIITTPGTFKKSFPEEIYSAFTKEAGQTQKPPKIFFIPDTAKAVDMALSTALENRLPVLGTGSFYLAAEIKKKQHFSKNFQF